jgi:hypothetical protein
MLITVVMVVVMPWAPILEVIIGIARIVGVVSATRIVAVIRPVMGGLNFRRFF